MPNPYTSAFKLGASTPASSNSSKGALIVHDSTSGAGSAVLYVLGPPGGSTVPITVNVVEDGSVVFPVRISGTGALSKTAVYELF